MSNTAFSTYKRLLALTKPYIGYFLLGVLGTIMLSGVDSLFMASIKPVIDKGFVKRDTVFVALLPLCVILIFLARGLANFMSSYYISRVSRAITRDLRAQIFSKLQRLSAGFFDTTSSGHLISTMLYNVEQVSQASSSVLITIVRETTLFFGLVIVMFVVNWRLASLFLLILPPIAWVIQWSSRRMRRLGVYAQEAMGDVTHIAGESIDNYRVVRLHAGIAYQEKKFFDAVNKNFQRELKITVTSSIGGSLTQTLFAIPLAIALGIATSPYLHVSAGSFASIIATMVSLLQPARRLTNVNNTIQKGIAGAISIFQILDKEEEVDQGVLTLSRAQGEIIFDRVCFQYQSSDRAILKNMSFTVPAGKTIALVGKSGGGKSTIVSLLPRFYEICGGEIRLDGKNIGAYSLESLRQQMAFVSQNTTLFDDTVAKNIAFGIENPDREDIVRAAEAAYAMEFISQLPNGLDTLIGENGVLLSGGSVNVLRLHVPY